MSVYIGDVQTFAGVIADKPQVLKIGEETMEVFSAWEDYKDCSYSQALHKEALVAEIADVIQAACNLLAAIGVDDMRQPMQECYVRNVERGREYETDENATTKCEIRDFDDSRERLEADVRQYLIRPTTLIDCTYDDVMRWLNRQAAITEREHPGLTVSDDESLINWHGRNYLLQSMVLNAERERDEFSLKLKHEMELNRDNRNAHDLERIDELQAENDGLKARVESLRSKLSKMLDAASAIQHIGDLP